MKVLHICDSLNPAGLGGYESYLHYLSKELASRDIESIVVTQKSSSEQPTQISRLGYDIVQLPGNGLEARKWEFFKHPEEVRDELALKMFKTDDLEENVSELVDQLTAVIASFGPAIIHAHSTYVVFNRVLDRLREELGSFRTPLILTVHGRPKQLILPDRSKTTDYEQLAACCPFNRVLAVSRNVEEVLGTHLPDSASIQTLYLGIDLGLFKPSKMEEFSWDLAFMGRLERMKAVDLLPEMLRDLSKSHPNLKLLITGEGSLREGLLEEFSQAGVSALVDYRGVVPMEQVPEMINRSRVFLYPSREEPFGLSVIEAMACGRPVLTTNVFGPSEIVTHPMDGYLVDPDDPLRLSEAASLLLSDEALQRRMGENARKTVEARFDMRSHADSLLKIYRDEIEG